MRRENGGTVPITTIVVDRGSPVPLYHQVAEHLRRLIASGGLTSGEHLPNELELAALFGLSRPTMRQALDELVRDGLIVRRRGVGTVVTPHDFRRGVSPTSIFEDLAATGRQPATQVLSIRAEAPTAELVEAYGEVDSVVVVERVRFADGVPLVLMRNWLPERYARLTASELEATGLYRTMAVYGDVPVKARKSIRACGAAHREARLLDVRRGAPLLRVRHVGYDAGGTIVDVGDHLFRGDDYAVEVVVAD